MVVVVQRAIDEPHILLDLLDASPIARGRAADTGRHHLIEAAKRIVDQIEVRGVAAASFGRRAA